MALATVATLVSRIQTLVDDPAGSWATYSYLQGFILQANEDLNAELDAYNLTYNEDIEVLSTVPAGTADLSAYMTVGQPLENLMTPTMIEWREVGTDDNNWKLVPRKDKLIDDTDASTVRSWTWRQQNIQITPCNADVDLRVSFDAITTNLDDQDSTILRGSCNVLAYRTARIVAAIRGGLSGNGEPLAKTLTVFEMEAKDSFESLMTKRDQSVRRSFGRNTISRARAGASLPIL